MYLLLSEIDNRTSCRPIPSVIILVIDRIPASRSSNFVYHPYDYRPNWTPIGPITIINLGKRKIVSVNFNGMNSTNKKIKMGKNLTVSRKSHHWPLRPSVNGSFGM